MQASEGEGVLTQDNFAVTYVRAFSVDNWDPEKESLVKDLNEAFQSSQTVTINTSKELGRCHGDPIQHPL